MNDPSGASAALLLFAMAEEAAGLQVPPSRVVLIGGSPYEVIVFGAGAANATDVQGRIAHPRVIHAGFAGALRPDFAAGDVFRVSSIRRSRDVLHLADPGAPYDRLPAASLVTIPAPATRAMKDVMRTDRAADLVDMESWHIARHCIDHGIEYIGLRAVSDALADEVPQAVIDSFDGRRFRRGSIIGALLRRPSLLRSLLKLRSNARRAAQRLAAAITAP